MHVEQAKDELFKKVDEYLEKKEGDKTLSPMEFFAIAYENGWRRRPDNKTG